MSCWYWRKGFIKQQQPRDQDRTSLATELRTDHAARVKQYLADEQVALSKVNLSDHLSKQIAEEHGKINEAIKQLTSNAVESLQPKDFDAVANVIEDHVRWDEREVLPYLQKTMTDSEREGLAQSTSEIELNRQRPIQQLHHSIALNKSSGHAQTCSCAECS